MRHRHTIEISTVDPQDAAIQRALWDLLVLIKHEFVPPLLVRDSTIAMNLSGVQNQPTEGSCAYFNHILRQNTIMAKVDGHWVGFFTFRRNFSLDLLQDYNPCNYLTTIGVDPSYRNIGLAQSMYRFALNELPPDLQSPYWVTRTWSNNNHIHLLEKIGFKLAIKVDNHRGEGIDSHYYTYKMPKSPRLYS